MPFHKSTVSWFCSHIAGLGLMGCIMTPYPRALWAVEPTIGRRATHEKAGEPSRNRARPEDIEWDVGEPPAGPQDLPEPPLRREPASTGDSPETNKPRPLSTIDLKNVFRPLEGSKLATIVREPQGLNPRDPYWGSSERIHLAWTARNSAHHTLYFDDMPAERLGQVHSETIQPIASTYEFLKDFVLFPLRWQHDRLGELHYTLGLERAGSPSPGLRERCPSTW